jgi:DNA replication protein DnaC
MAAEACGSTGTPAPARRRWRCHIDDLGAEKRSDWVLEQLYAIVNERYEAERSIIVTTNLIDIGELEQQIGERTVSRLSEVCETIALLGTDQRYSQAA